MMIRMTSLVLFLTASLQLTTAQHEYMVFAYNLEATTVDQVHCEGVADVAILAEMRECASEVTGAVYDAALTKEVVVVGPGRKLRKSHDQRELQVCGELCSCRDNLGCQATGYCGSSCGIACDCRRRLEDEFVFPPAAEEEETGPRDLSVTATFLSLAETGPAVTIGEMNTQVSANCQSKLGMLGKALNEENNYCLGNYETLQVEVKILS
jgi:hypothetical protein